MKNTRRITQVLALATLGIWGTIGYQIYSAGRSPDTDGSEPTATTHSVQSAPFVYEADVRDPFRMTDPADSTKHHPRAVKAPPWIPPPLKVTGILEQRKNRTAILEGPTGVFFMKERDTLLGVKILKIENSRVVYQYNGKKSEWPLQ